MGGQVFDHAFLVGNAERVQEVHEHLFVLLEQPGADEVAGHQFQRRPGQRGQHHRVLLRARLAFQEDGPQLPRLGHRAERGR